MFKRRVERKNKRGLCATRRCQNLRRKDRVTCHTCDTRKRRASNPMRNAFRSNKTHAKERGIEWTLTFEQFEEFALKYDYLGRKGQDRQCLTVDRVDNKKGYHFDNIQPLSREANTRKMRKYDAIRNSIAFGRKADIDAIINDYTGQAIPPQTNPWDAQPEY